MKKLYIGLLLCIGITPAFSQALFTYGGQPVNKEEFLKAYNKNKTPAPDKASSLREYLELYTRFKLKVKAAELQRLDTLQQLKYDLQNFRSQVEESFLNDEKGLNALADEAIERAQKDIHVIQYFIPRNDSTNAADTGKLYGLLNDLARDLTTANTTPVNTILPAGEKYKQVIVKDLGYITVLTLPYEIESRVYALKPGEVTSIIRTRSGIHIFKNAGERKSAGKWKVAQILISIPPGASGNELTAAEKKADSVHQLIIKGADFATIAKQVSEDKLTYQNGGEMPEFGTGKFDPHFESKIFELKKDGEISKPFLTSYGFHIVKRISQVSTPANKREEEYVAILKQAIVADGRINASQENFLKEIKNKTGYKRNPVVKDETLFRYADSVSATGIVKKYPINNQAIFSFSKTAVKGEDWLNFIKDYKLNKDVYKGESNKILLDKFISTASFDYYRKHLEEYNADFKKQMQEFKEGNMLFEIMERNVWGKASGDSLGLLKYYNDHRAKYTWNESAAVILFNCSDSIIANDVAKVLQAGKNWKELVSESDGHVQADSGRYEISQLQVPVNVSLKEGTIIWQNAESGDNTSGFIKVLKLFPANLQRSFEEARGLVINDYQTFLDEMWIAELRKKYPVIINETVFQELLKQ